MDSIVSALPSNLKVVRLAAYSARGSRRLINQCRKNMPSHTVFEESLRKV